MVSCFYLIWHKTMLFILLVPKPAKYDKVVEREVCRITTKGTKVYSFLDGDSVTPQSAYTLSIYEKVKCYTIEFKTGFKQYNYNLFLGKTYMHMSKPCDDSFNTWSNFKLVCLFVYLLYSWLNLIVDIIISCTFWKFTSLVWQVRWVSHTLLLHGWQTQIYLYLLIMNSWFEMRLIFWFWYFVCCVIRRKLRWLVASVHTESVLLIHL